MPTGVLPETHHPVDVMFTVVEKLLQWWACTLQVLPFATASVQAKFPAAFSTKATHCDDRHSFMGQLGNLDKQQPSRNVCIRLYVYIVFSLCTVTITTNRSTEKKENVEICTSHDHISGRLELESVHDTITLQAGEARSNK